jgi:hypothetical protein
MRTIGFHSNILFAIAAAFGVIAALDQPWYGRAPDATSARMEDLFGGVGRAFSEAEGTSGWQALQTADELIAGLALGAVVLLVLSVVPALHASFKPAARWAALATLGVVLFKLVDGPGTDAMSEPRHGLFIALGSALVLLASTATGGVQGRSSRARLPTAFYTPPPAAVYDKDAVYEPPQY